MSGLVCPKCGTLSVGRSKDEDMLRARVAELEVDLTALGKLYESRGEYIAEMEAERDALREQATNLLDAAFQTVDPEDAEAIVAEAFPGGGPEWVLAWYREHPTEEDLGREGGKA